MSLYDKNDKKLAGVPGVPMPGPAPKSHRKVEEILQEFTNMSARVGQLQYQINVYKRDLEMLYSSMEKLSIEAAEAKQAAKLAAVEGEKANA